MNPGSKFEKFLLAIIFMTEVACSNVCFGYFFNFKVLTCPAPVSVYSSQCGYHVPSAYVAGSGVNSIFHWYLDSVGGIPLSGETGTFLTSYFISETDTFYVSEYDGICESDRTMVIANVTVPPILTITSSQNVCSNVAVPLTITSFIGEYDLITWSPFTNLYLDPAATIPYNGENLVTVYEKVTGAINIEYTCLAINTLSTCSSIATVIITESTDDYNVCTVDYCEPGTGIVTHSPVDSDDGNNCTTDGCDTSIGVFHNPVPALILDSIVTVSDSISGDGALYISVSGGTVPYTYQWSNGETTEDLTGLQAGTYTLIVTDSIDCTRSFEIEVTRINDPRVNLCGFDSLLHRRLMNAPGYQLEFDSLENEIQRYINNNLQRSYITDYTIPVVVHVIMRQPDAPYYGFRSNISYEQIQSQISALNAAFLKDYPNYNKQLHGPHAEDMNIKFCLAKTPMPSSISWETHNNIIEYGVMRYSRPESSTVHELDITYDATNDVLTDEIPLLDITHPQGQGRFPFDKYLNIWLVSDICEGGKCNNNLSGNPTTVGVATMPRSNPDKLDGIIFRIDCFGDNTIPTITPFQRPNFTQLRGLTEGKMLAHEAGHFLELFHTHDPYPQLVSSACSGKDLFGVLPDPCNINGDRCCDTPPTQIIEYQFSNLPTNSCQQTSQIENYMSYSYDLFMNTFTSDQKKRMIASLNVTKRSNLWQNENLELTGVQDTLIPGKCSCCKLTAEFTIDKDTICPGESVHLFTPDGPTYCAKIWTWTFAGGNPSTVTINYPDPPVTPAVQFTGYGAHTVTLTVSDGIPGHPSVSKQLNVVVDIALIAGMDLSANDTVCSDEIQYILIHFPCINEPFSITIIDNNNNTITFTGITKEYMKFPVRVSSANFTFSISSVTVGAITGNGTGSVTFKVKNCCPVITASCNSPVCEGDILQFYADGGKDYIWKRPDGTDFSYARDPSIMNVSRAMEGIYTLVSSNDSCPDSIATVLVIVKPAVTVSNNGPLCEGKDLLLFSSDGLQHSWTGPANFQSLPVARTQNPILNNVTTANAGVYTVSITNGNTWTRKADFNGTVTGAVTGRYQASGFSIGNKGYIGTGGTANAYDKSEDFFEYTPETNPQPGTWQQKANSFKLRGTVGFSIGNKGYFGTGAPTSNSITHAFWEFDPKKGPSGTWTQKANFAGDPRDQATGFSIGNKGYIGTGAIESAALLVTNDFWEYDPVNNRWAKKADFGGAPRMWAVGFSIGNKGYIGTGRNNNSNINYNDFWEFDPEDLSNGVDVYGYPMGKWTLQNAFAGGLRYGAVGFSIGCKGYIGTGSDGTALYNDFWEYDPGNGPGGLWTKKSNVSLTPRAFGVGLRIANKGYIGTGIGGGNNIYNDFWEYDPVGCGCDSTATTEVIIYSISYTIDTAICADQAYPDLPWGGTAAEGDNVHHYILPDGCDSVVTFHLTVNPLFNINITDSICAGESYDIPWGGATNTAGTYSHIYQSVNGCDSVVSIALLVHDVYSANRIDSICQGNYYDLPWGGTTNTAGIYSHIYQSVYGCDSVVSIALLVHDVYSANLIDSICQGNYYHLPWGGTVNTAGLYTHVYHLPTGCDSIVNITLIVHDIYSTNLTYTICQGNYYHLPWGGAVNTAGLYTHVYHLPTGCDSIVNITLIVHDIYSTNLTYTICQGNYYHLPWGGAVNTAGLYTHVYHLPTGCDSVVSIEILVTGPILTKQKAFICEGENFELPWGGVVSTSGNYSFVYQTGVGCDSIVIIHLTAYPVYETHQTVSICEGTDFYLPWGGIANATGDYSHKYTSELSCDSILIIHLTVIPDVIANITDEFCQGGFYYFPWGGTTNIPGNYSYTYLLPDGCDSVVNLLLAIHYNDTTYVTDSVCDGFAYTLPWGVSIYNAGDYIYSYNNPGYCDSIVLLHLVEINCPCGISHHLGHEMIFNGDFENGNYGFNSDYYYFPAGGGIATSYTIKNNAQLSYPFTSPCIDHTPSTTAVQMMCVCQDFLFISPEPKVWGQTVVLKPHTDYIFSFWVTSISVFTAPLQFVVEANTGLFPSFPVSPLYEPNLNVCDWQQFVYTWNSGNYSGAVEMRINILNLFHTIFAIDDISLRGCDSLEDPDEWGCHLHLKVLMEGFYLNNGKQAPVVDPLSLPSACDTITVELHDVNYPYNTVYSQTGTISTNGNGLFIFPASAIGNNYYLAIRHRNALETWSKLPVMFSAPVINFDFTQY